MPAEDAIETTEQFREEIRGLFLTMSKDLSGMAKDMGSLKSAVVGDPMTGTTGLLLRMTDTEKAADVLERHLEKEIQELKNKSLGELERIVLDSGEKLRALRFDLAAGKVKNVNELHQTRKTIARAKTFLRAEELKQK